ncbi:MAG: hypothetical protein GXP31_04840 [Kiritimatiellaeota bacterium]|nr:hypothetical protein [Kiritimatiellota bacterium]
MNHASTQNGTAGGLAPDAGTDEPAAAAFRQRLARLAWGLRFGRLTEAATAGLFRIVLVVAALTVFDLAAAPGPGLRAGLGLAALMVLLPWGAFGLTRSLGVNARDAARRVDELAGDRRRPVLTAWELLAARPAAAFAESASLHRFLTGRILAQAAARIEPLTGRRLWPTPAIRRRLRAFFLLLLALTIVAVPARRAVGTALLRSCLPWRDVPPYTRYRFAVKPDPAVVLYGNAVELTAAVSGPRVQAPVRVTTRADGKTASALCFRRGAREFLLRVEHVVRPFEFCFRIGRRARTRWRRVTVRLEPRFEEIRLVLDPPSYTHRPRRSFRSGLGSVNVLRGTGARLEVRSNRPLAGGTLTILTAGDQRVRREVTGRGHPPGKVAVFAWTVDCGGAVEVRLRDVQGIVSRTPLCFDLVLEEDKPPAAGLSAPPSVSVATPDARLPLVGWAEDDVGLSSVRWVRAVRGYRDRSVALPVPAAVARYDFQRSLDLGVLGVAPGDVLEFYLEARDNNPEVPGVNVSEIARVTVISKEQYARILRARTTLEEIAARAKLIEQALDTVRKAAEALRKEAAEGGNAEPDRKKTRRRIAALRKALEQVRKVLDRLAAELPVYASEKALHKSLEATRKALGKAAQIVAGMQPGSPGLTEKVDSVLDMLGERSRQARRDWRQAAQLAVIARLMQAGVMYVKSVELQEDIVRRLSRFEPENARQDPDYVRLFADRERRVREALAVLPERIRALADRLSDEYFEVRDSARAFAMDLERLKLPALLEQAEAAMRAGDGRTACRLAGEALEKMRELRRKYDSSTCYGALCVGKCRFSLPGPGTETLAQVYALLAGAGGGGGGGFGSAGYAGGYGKSEHGYGMSGWAAAATALYGPPRLQPVGGGGRRDADGNGRTTAASVNVERLATEKRVDTPRTRRPAGRDIRPRRVPEKYRKAVERYFAASPKPQWRPPPGNEADRGNQNGLRGRNETR